MISGKLYQFLFILLTDKIYITVHLHGKWLWGVYNNAIRTTVFFLIGISGSTDFLRKKMKRDNTVVLEKTVKRKYLFPHNHLFVSQPFNIVCFPTLRKVLKGIVMYYYMHFSTAESMQVSCHVNREGDRQPGSGTGRMIDSQVPECGLSSGACTATPSIPHHWFAGWSFWEQYFRIIWKIPSCPPLTVCTARWTNIKWGNMILFLCSLELSPILI